MSIVVTIYDEKLAPPASPTADDSVGRRTAETLKAIGDLLLLTLKLWWIMTKGLFRIFVPASKKSVKGEIVLITGAAHGIGRELALQYASKGATVVCCDINRTGNEETAEEIAKLGYPKAHAFVCDVTKRDRVLEVAMKVQREVGDVTILINNAGIMVSHSLLEHTAEELERTVHINFMAHFWTIQAFLPSMLNNNYGHIVCISSLCGRLGFKNLVPYCASKYAVRGLMDALAVELRADPRCKVKLTTIFPYGVDTKLCKKPVLRFPNALAFLDPCDVARKVMTAQRRELTDATLPGYLGIGTAILKLIPETAEHAIMDYLGITFDSDFPFPG